MLLILFATISHVVYLLPCCFLAFGILHSLRIRPAISTVSIPVMLEGCLGCFTLPRCSQSQSLGVLPTTTRSLMCREKGSLMSRENKTMNRKETSNNNCWGFFFYYCMKSMIAELYVSIFLTLYALTYITTTMKLS